MIITVPTSDMPIVKASCSNCIYGDYWSDIDGERQVYGFDCSYPIYGSKLSPKVNSSLITGDESIAQSCHKYQLGDATN
jgi:hypothetical protein